MTIWLFRRQRDWLTDTTSRFGIGTALLPAYPHIKGKVTLPSCPPSPRTAGTSITGTCMSARSRAVSVAARRPIGMALRFYPGIQTDVDKGRPGGIPPCQTRTVPIQIKGGTHTAITGWFPTYGCSCGPQNGDRDVKPEPE